MTASEPPSVTALVAAYNAEPFIEAALDSLAAQTYPNFRVLISDDASGDGTADVCARYVATDPRFTLVRQPKNLGWARNTRELISRCEGAFAFFMENDDQVAPTYVERCVAAATDRPDAAVWFTDMELVNGDLVGLGDELVYAELEGVDDAFARARSILRREGVVGVPWRGLVRVDVMKNLGGFSELGGDGIWMLRLSEYGAFVRVPEPLYRKVYRRDSVSLGRRFMWLRVLGSRAKTVGVVMRMGFSLSQRIRLLGALGTGMLRNAMSLLRRVTKGGIRRRR